MATLNYRTIPLDLSVAASHQQLVEPNVGIASVSIRVLSDGSQFQFRYGVNGQPSSVTQYDSIAFPRLLTDGLYGDWPAQVGKVAELFVTLAPIVRS